MNDQNKSEDEINNKNTLITITKSDTPKNENTDKEFLIVLTILSVIFLFIGLYMCLYLDALNEKTISKYFTMIYATSYIAFLYAVSKYNIKDAYKILITIISFIILFSTSSYIKNMVIKSHYENIEAIVINDNKDLKNTNIYKEFKVHKDNLDKEKIVYYFKNINKYKSINKEEIIKLKILYTLTTNVEMKNKLDKLFKEEIISINKYNEFQDFIYNMKLSNNDIEHLNYIDKKAQ